MRRVRQVELVSTPTRPNNTGYMSTRKLERHGTSDLWTSGFLILMKSWQSEGALLQLSSANELPNRSPLHEERRRKLKECARSRRPESKKPSTKRLAVSSWALISRLRKQLTLGLG